MTPDQLRDASMLELFHMEAQSQTQVLGSGLLMLERNPTDPVQLEACMRSAHSLKGAARIVGLDNAVQLAHKMEDIFVAAQRGELRLDSARINTLLRGSDALLRIGEGGAVDALPELLAQLDHHRTLVDAAPQEASPAVALPTTPGSDEDANDQRERVLRVSAERLDLILDLAGRSIVATQAAQPLNLGLQRLHRVLGQAQHALNRLRETLLTQSPPPRTLALLGDAQTWLSEAHGLQQQHAQAFESYTWDSAKRAKQLYDTALASRMRPCSDLMTGKARMVRDLGNTLGKPVHLEIEGAQTQADRDLLERLEAPLIQLLRNAVDHGIEPAPIRRDRGKPAQGRLLLRMSHTAGRLLLELEDDGGGVDLDRVRAAVLERRLATPETVARMDEDEVLAFLFLPGFSLSPQITEISGRGVGLDVVQHTIRQLHGSVRLRQRHGLGSTFGLELPLALSVLRSLVVLIGGQAYALPLAQVERTLRLAPDAVQLVEGQQHFWQGERPIGLIAASQLLQLTPGEADPKGIPVVLLRERETTHALVVDRIVGEQSLVVMTLDPRLGPVRDVAAGALLEDGTPVLILDVEAVLGSITKLLGAGQLERISRSAVVVRTDQRRILVVDDSLTVRELERKLLAGHGYGVVVAVDGLDAWNLLHTEGFDLLVTDIDMPRMDGIELVTRVRADTRLQSLPVIVVSYKDREEDRLRGMEAGADHYLAKSSFHDDTLLEAVRLLIGEAEA